MFCGVVDRLTELRPTSHDRDNSFDPGVKVSNVALVLPPWTDTRTQVPDTPTHREDKP